MLSMTFDDRGGAGPITLTFHSTSAGPGPHSAPLKFYIYSVEIAIPLMVILIPVFHTCYDTPKGRRWLYSSPHATGASTYLRPGD